MKYCPGGIEVQSRGGIVPKSVDLNICSFQNISQSTRIIKSFWGEKSVGVVIVLEENKVRRLHMVMGVTEMDSLEKIDTIRGQICLNRPKIKGEIAL